MVNKLFIDYEFEFFCRFESDDGQKFYFLGMKICKIDLIVIEYIDRNNMFCYGRVILFLKIVDFGFCVGNELEENFDLLLFFNE